MAKNNIDQAPDELAIALQKLTDTETALEETKQQLNDALSLNDSLTLEVEKLSSGKGRAGAEKKPKEKPLDPRDYSFENNGVTYGFKYPVQMFNKVRITPLEVCADKDLQDKLIEAKNSMIYVK